MMNLIKGSLSTLTYLERTKFVAAITLQLAVAILDLLGVLVFSVLANLLLTGNLYIPNKTLEYALDAAFDVNSRGFNFQLFTLSALVLLLLVGRSILSMTLMRKLSFFLVRKSTHLSSSLIRQILLNYREYIDTKSVQSTQLMLTRGVNSLISKLLGGLVSLASDLSILVALSIGLLVFEPSLSSLGIAIFGGSFYLINFVSKRYISRQAQREKENEIAVKENVDSVFRNYRDFVINSNLDSFLNRLQENYLAASLSAFRVSFVNIFNRYLYEAVLIISIFLFGLIAFQKYESRVALTVLATFVLAVTRMVPSVIRIQQQMNQMQAVEAFAQDALALCNKFILKGRILPEAIKRRVNPTTSNSQWSSIELDNVHYLSNDHVILTSISFRIYKGEKIALVGESGSGKTTLIDLIAGIKKISMGSICIDGIDIGTSTINEKISVGYVPQSVGLIRGTVLENIEMFRDKISSSDIQRALEISRLGEFLDSLPEGLNTHIGDGNKTVSGGEIQRIGLARALTTTPQLLILDEFTSSLDQETESYILNQLFDRVADVTIVSAVHKLRTLKFYSRVIELSKGKIVRDLPTKEWLQQKR